MNTSLHPHMDSISDPIQRLERRLRWLQESLPVDSKTHIRQEIEEALTDLQNIMAYFPQGIEDGRATISWYALQAAIETVEVGVTITDTQGRIIYTNTTEARMHGYRVEELIGQPARMFAPPEIQREMSPEEMKQIKNWRRESLNLHKDGSIFPVQLISNAIIDAAGNPLGLATICEDITERKAAEEKLHRTNSELAEALNHLEALNREKNELLSIVAHDLKNPLSAIRGTAESIYAFYDVLSKEEVVQHALDIEHGANRMFELINNLLDLDALEVGKMNLRFEEFDLRIPLLMVVNNFSQTASSKNIQIVCEPLEVQYPVYADEKATLRVLDNLVSNAVKYSPRGKSIYIRLEKTRGYVRCYVRDEGPGLSASDQKKLFEKFAKLSPKPTGGEHSTGLGLSIVKKLVEAMHGSVWCESEPGQGATFIAEFPTHKTKVNTDDDMVE